MYWSIKAPYLEITSQCNLHCTHCYNSSSSEKATMLTKDSIISCLDFFSYSGVKDLSISGGEPLLHPDVVSVLSAAYGYGFNTLLATNGTLLTEEIIQSILPYVKYYQISVDGNERSHDTVRGQGSYDAAFIGIGNLCALGLQKRTRLRMTITKNNYNTIQSLIDKAAELGLEAVHFSIVRNQGRANESFESTFQIPDNTLIEIYYFINDLRKRHIGDLEISPLTIDGGKCTLLSETPVLRPRIDVNGDIYPCEGYLDSAYRLGHVSENLSTVFSSNRVLPYVEKLAQMRKQSIECDNCFWDKFLCLRGCPAEAHSLGDDAGTDGLCGIRKRIWNKQLRDKTINKIKEGNSDEEESIYQTGSGYLQPRGTDKYD